MVNITNPPLPKFDTTSLNADLANKIKAPELQQIPDGSGNLRSMIKDQSMQFGTNIEGTLDQFGENIEAEAERKAAELEAAAKQIEAAALAAAKMIEEELKRKKEEAKKAIEDAKKQAKEAYQKALTAKEQAEDMIAKLRGFKIPRLKKLKPVPTKDLPAPPQYAKYMDNDAKKEYAESVKSSATKGEPPAESLVAKPEIKIPNYRIEVFDAGGYFIGRVFADGRRIEESPYTFKSWTKEKIENALKNQIRKYGFTSNYRNYPPNPSFV
jgi:hypothetical protein